MKRKKVELVIKINTLNIHWFNFHQKNKPKI
jgi:hypothetical protein